MNKVLSLLLVLISVRSFALSNEEIPQDLQCVKKISAIDCSKLTQADPNGPWHYTTETCRVAFTYLRVDGTVGVKSLETISQGHSQNGLARIIGDVVTFGYNEAGNNPNGTKYDAKSPMQAKRAELELVLCPDAQSTP